MLFENKRCDIPNINKASENGYITSKGIELGLNSSKRMRDKFAIESQTNKGTRVTLITWK